MSDNIITVKLLEENLEFEFKGEVTKEMFDSLGDSWKEKTFITTSNISGIPHIALLIPHNFYVKKGMPIYFISFFSGIPNKYSSNTIFSAIIKAPINGILHDKHNSEIGHYGDTLCEIEPCEDVDTLFQRDKELIKQQRQEKSAKTEIDGDCYVYLMEDTSNHYYKIGISNKPKYREHTLQSEKPTIELLVAKKFPTRKLAEVMESTLHNVYSKQRIRGEWFNLSQNDVDEITQTLK